MKIELLHSTPLRVADYAICKCYGNKPHDDVTKQQKRIYNVANVSKHSSTVEHLVYTFDIDGISRAVLQELARHRIASYTVKSSRYVLSKDLRGEVPFILDEDSRCRASKYITLTGNEDVDTMSIIALENLRQLVNKGIKNDLTKYCMPECIKTSLVMTINARALQNFLSLRTDKHALWEIRELAYVMFEVLPEEHKFLFKEYIYEEKENTKQ